MRAVIALIALAAGVAAAASIPQPTLPKSEVRALAGFPASVWSLPDFEKTTIAFGSDHHANLVFRAYRTTYRTRFSYVTDYNMEAYDVFTNRTVWSHQNLSSVGCRGGVAWITTAPLSKNTLTDPVRDYGVAACTYGYVFLFNRTSGEVLHGATLGSHNIPSAYERGRFWSQSTNPQPFFHVWSGTESLLAFRAGYTSSPVMGILHLTKTVTVSVSKVFVCPTAPSGYSNQLENFVFGNIAVTNVAAPQALFVAHCRFNIVAFTATGFFDEYAALDVMVSSDSRHFDRLAVDAVALDATASRIVFAGNNNTMNFTHYGLLTLVSDAVSSKVAVSASVHATTPYAVDGYMYSRPAPEWILCVPTEAGAQTVVVQLAGERLVGFPVAGDLLASSWIAGFQFVYLDVVRTENTYNGITTPSYESIRSYSYAVRVPVPAGGVSQSMLAFRIESIFIVVNATTGLVRWSDVPRTSSSSTLQSCSDYGSVPLMHAWSSATNRFTLGCSNVNYGIDMTLDPAGAPLVATTFGSSRYSTAIGGMHAFGDLLVVDQTNHFFAFPLTARAWSHRTAPAESSGYGSSAVVRDGVVYTFTSTNARATSRSGQTLWETSYGGKAASGQSPVLYEQYVLQMSNGEQVWVYDAYSGKHMGTVALESSCPGVDPGFTSASTLTVTSGGIYITRLSCVLRLKPDLTVQVTQLPSGVKASNSHTPFLAGRPVESITLRAPLTPNQQYFVFASTGGQLFAFDTATAQLAWNVVAIEYAQGSYGSVRVAASGNVIVLSTTTSVTCRFALSGVKLWDYDLTPFHTTYYTTIETPMIYGNVAVVPIGLTILKFSLDLAPSGGERLLSSFTVPNQFGGYYSNVFVTARMSQYGIVAVVRDNALLAFDVSPSGPAQLTPLYNFTLVSRTTTYYYSSSLTIESMGFGVNDPHLLLVDGFHSGTEKYIIVDITTGRVVYDVEYGSTSEYTSWLSERTVFAVGGYFIMGYTLPTVVAGRTVIPPPPPLPRVQPINVTVPAGFEPPTPAPTSLPPLPPLDQQGPLPPPALGWTHAEKYDRNFYTDVVDEGTGKGVVFVFAYPFNNVTALNASDGTVLWFSDPPHSCKGRYTSAKVVGYWDPVRMRRVAVLFCFHEIHAFDAWTGESFWNTTAFSSVSFSQGMRPSIANGIVSCVVYRHILSYNISDGSLLYNYTRSGHYPQEMEALTLPNGQVVTVVRYGLSAEVLSVTGAVMWYVEFTKASFYSSAFARLGTRELLFFTWDQYADIGETVANLTTVDLTTGATTFSQTYQTEEFLNISSVPTLNVYPTGLDSFVAVLMNYNGIVAVDMTRLNRGVVMWSTNISDVTMQHDVTQPSTWNFDRYNPTAIAGSLYIYGANDHYSLAGFQLFNLDLFTGAKHWNHTVATSAHPNNGQTYAVVADPIVPTRIILSVSNYLVIFNNTTGVPVSGFTGYSNWHYSTTGLYFFNTNAGRALVGTTQYTADVITTVVVDPKVPGLAPWTLYAEESNNGEVQLLITDIGIVVSIREPFLVAHTHTGAYLWHAYLTGTPFPSGGTIAQFGSMIVVRRATQLDAYDAQSGSHAGTVTAEEMFGLCPHSSSYNSKFLVLMPGFVTSAPTHQTMHVPVPPVADLPNGLLFVQEGECFFFINSGLQVQAQLIQEQYTPTLANGVAFQMTSDMKFYVVITTADAVRGVQLDAAFVEPTQRHQAMQAGVSAAPPKIMWMFHSHLFSADAGYGFTQMAMDGTFAYVVTSRSVWALQITTGQLAWTQAFHTGTYSSSSYNSVAPPVMINNTLHVLQRSYWVAIDLNDQVTDGARVLRSHYVYASLTVDSAPIVISNRYIFVGAEGAGLRLDTQTLSLATRSHGNYYTQVRLRQCATDDKQSGVLLVIADDVALYELLTGKVLQTLALAGASGECFYNSQTNEAAVATITRPATSSLPAAVFMQAMTTTSWTLPPHPPPAPTQAPLDYTLPPGYNYELPAPTQPPTNAPLPPQISKSFPVGRWTATTSSTTIVTPVATLLLTTTSQHHKIEALNTADGTTLWTMQPTTAICGSTFLSLHASAVVGSDDLFVFSCQYNAQTVHLADLKTGAIVSTATVNGSFWVSNARATKPVYFPTSKHLCLRTYLYVSGVGSEYSVECVDTSAATATTKGWFMCDAGHAVSAFYPVTHSSGRDAVGAYCSYRSVTVFSPANGNVMWSSAPYDAVYSSYCPSQPIVGRTTPAAAPFSGASDWVSYMTLCNSSSHYDSATGTEYYNLNITVYHAATGEMSTYAVTTVHSSPGSFHLVVDNLDVRLVLRAGSTLHGYLLSRTPTGSPMGPTPLSPMWNLTWAYYTTLFPVSGTRAVSIGYTHSAYIHMIDLTTGNNTWTSSAFSLTSSTSLDAVVTLVPNSASPEYLFIGYYGRNEYLIRYSTGAAVWSSTSKYEYFQVSAGIAYVPQQRCIAYATDQTVMCAGVENTLWTFTPEVNYPVILGTLPPHGELLLWDHQTFYYVDSVTGDVLRRRSLFPYSSNFNSRTRPRLFGGASGNATAVVFHAPYLWFVETLSGSLIDVFEFPLSSPTASDGGITEQTAMLTAAVLHPGNDVMYVPGSRSGLVRLAVNASGGAPEMQNTETQAALLQLEYWDNEQDPPLIIALDTANRLFAYDPVTLELHWNATLLFRTNAYYNPLMRVYGDYVVAGNGDGELIALSLITGQYAFEYDFGIDLSDLRDVVTWNNTLYFTAGTDIIALSMTYDKTDYSKAVNNPNQLQWHTVVPNLAGGSWKAITVAPFVVPCGVIMVGVGYTLAGFSTSTGALLWNVSLSGSCSNPTLVNEYLFLQCSRVTAFHVQTGVELMPLDTSSYTYDMFYDSRTQRIVASTYQNVFGVKVPFDVGPPLAPVASLAAPRGAPPSFFPRTNELVQVPSLPPGVTLPSLDCRRKVQRASPAFTQCVNGLIDNAYATATRIGRTAMVEFTSCMSNAVRMNACSSAFLSTMGDDCGAGVSFLRERLKAFNGTGAMDTCFYPRGVGCKDGLGGWQAWCTALNPAVPTTVATLPPGETVYPDFTFLPSPAAPFAQPAKPPVGKFTRTLTITVPPPTTTTTAPPTTTTTTGAATTTTGAVTTTAAATTTTAPATTTTAVPTTTAVGTTTMPATTTTAPATTTPVASTTATSTAVVTTTTLPASTTGTATATTTTTTPASTTGAASTTAAPAPTLANVFEVTFAAGATIPSDAILVKGIEGQLKSTPTSVTVTRRVTDARTGDVTVYFTVGDAAAAVALTERIDTPQKAAAFARILGGSTISNAPNNGGPSGPSKEDKEIATGLIVGLILGGMALMLIALFGFQARRRRAEPEGGAGATGMTSAHELQARLYDDKDEEADAAVKDTASVADGRNNQQFVPLVESAPSTNMLRAEDSTRSDDGESAIQNA